MISLFSSFDLNFFFYSFYLLILIFSFFLNLVFPFSFLKKNLILIFYSLEEFFFSVKLNFFNKIFIFILLNFIIFIFLLNFVGLWPYNFSFTSQIGLVFWFSVLVWFILIIFFIKKSHRIFSSHLIPEGSPLLLTPFLFIIEIVRIIIRPLTLSIRLAANILSGHLLLILLFKIVFFQKWFFLFFLVLNFIEIFVSLIQSYIFVTIICLYFSEIY